MGRYCLPLVLVRTMQEPPFSRKVQVVAGFFVSFAGLFWLLSLPYKPHEILPRLGFIAATICTGGSLMFFSAASFAYVVRKRKWSGRACKWAGLLFAVPGTFLIFAGAFLIFPGAPFFSVGAMLFCLTPLTGPVCRRLAFPELTDEQASALELPPSLFPK
jgi:hypothetical protein